MIDMTIIAREGIGHFDVRENGDSTARRWLAAGIDKPSCESERVLWRSTCPGGLLAADWLQLLQVGVGVQCLVPGGPGPAAE